MKTLAIKRNTPDYPEHDSNDEIDAEMLDLQVIDDKYDPDIEFDPPTLYEERVTAKLKRNKKCKRDEHRVFHSRGKIRNLKTEVDKKTGERRTRPYLFTDSPKLVKRKHRNTKRQPRYDTWRTFSLKNGFYHEVDLVDVKFFPIVINQDYNDLINQSFLSFFFETLLRSS